MSDLSLLMDMGFPQEKAKSNIHNANPCLATKTRFVASQRTPFSHPGLSKRVTRFCKKSSERALSVTGNKGVEPAMEWLLAHVNTMEGNSGAVPQDNSGAVGDTEAAGTLEITTDESETIHSVQDLGDDLSALAKSLQCDECNKKFRTDAEVEFHAIKTGHQKFSESCEEIKPLTEEEKKERLKKLEIIIKQRRAEKAEQEKREALEKEKSRRKTGQELTHVRQKMQEDEMKQLAELKRREKLEAKQAKQRVLEQIERDKQARREKFGMAVPPAPAPTVVAPPAAPATPAQTYDECNIQVRLTNGVCLTHKFSPNEQLAAVRLFVQINRTDSDGPFNLMTNFPKKVFTEDDMNTPLNVLGLVPSAVLIVCKQQTSQ